jgi:hypothetical protein
MWGYKQDKSNKALNSYVHDYDDEYSARYEAELLVRIRKLRRQNAGNAVAGFTILYGQGSIAYSARIVALCKRLNVPVFHLIRRNKLRLLISREALAFESRQGKQSNLTGEHVHGNVGLNNIGHGKPDALNAIARSI